MAFVRGSRCLQPLYCRTLQLRGVLCGNYGRGTLVWNLGNIRGLAALAKASVKPVEKSKQFKAVVTTPDGNEFLLGVYNSEAEAEKVVSAAQEQLKEAGQSGKPKHPRKPYRGFHGVIFDRDSRMFEAVLELPHRGTEVSGGEYDTPEAAARAYDALVRMYASEAVSGRDDVAMWGSEEVASSEGGSAQAESLASSFAPPLNFPQQAGTVPPTQAPSLATAPGPYPPSAESSTARASQSSHAVPSEFPSVDATASIDASDGVSLSHPGESPPLSSSSIQSEAPIYAPEDAPHTPGEFSWVPPTQQRPHERAADPIPVREGQPLAPDEVARALREEGGVDVRVLDVSRKTSLAEHLIFVTGRTTSHMRRLADMVCRALRRRKLREWDSVGRWEVENRSGDDWMAVDCGNMVVNVFEADARASLNVEGIWDRDLPERVEVEDADAQMERNAQALATGALMPGDAAGAGGSVEDLVQAASPWAAGHDGAGHDASREAVLEAAREGATLADVLLAEPEEGAAQDEAALGDAGLGSKKTKGLQGAASSKNGAKTRKRFGRMKRSKKAALEKESEAKMLQWLEDNPISPGWERRMEAEMRADEIRTLDIRERRRGKRGGRR